MTKMHLGKWGRSLALRMPSSIIEELGLKAGDPVDMDKVCAALRDSHKEALQEKRNAALEEIRKGRIRLPADWKFDREEANWRPAMDKW